MRVSIGLPVRPLSWMRCGRTWLRSSRQPSLAMKRFQTWHSSSVRGVPWAWAQFRTASSALAGERALPDLGIGDAEETAAAPVERELVLAEVLCVIRRELIGGVQANLIEHPPEIDQTSDFVVATAQAWNVLHKRNMNRKQVIVTFPQMPSVASRDRASLHLPHLVRHPLQPIRIPLPSRRQR